MQDSGPRQTLFCSLTVASLHPWRSITVHWGVLAKSVVVSAHHVLLASLRRMSAWRLTVVCTSLPACGGSISKWECAGGCVRKKSWSICKPNNNPENVETFKSKTNKTWGLFSEISFKSQNFFLGQLDFMLRKKFRCAFLGSGRGLMLVHQKVLSIKGLFFHHNLNK